MVGPLGGSPPPVTSILAAMHPLNNPVRPAVFSVLQPRKLRLGKAVLREWGAQELVQLPLYIQMLDLMTG